MIEGRFEVEIVPLQPRTFEDIFSTVERGAIEAGSAEPEQEVELSPRNYAHFLDRLALARQHKEANEIEVAWYYLADAQAIVDFQRGYREGFFRCNEKHVGKGSLPDGHDEVVRVMLETHSNKQWGELEAFEDALRAAGRKANYGVGRVRLLQLKADKRLARMIKGIKSGG